MKAISLYLYRLVPRPLLVLVVMAATLNIVAVTAFTQNTSPAPVPPAQPPALGPACQSRVGAALAKGTPSEGAIAPSPPEVIPAAVTAANNYVFSTATNASFTDMSS